MGAANIARRHKSFAPHSAYYLEYDLSRNHAGDSIDGAGDSRGNISPAAALLPLTPVPYVTSAEAGWDGFTRNFGKIFSAGPSRQIQFRLKLTF